MDEHTLQQQENDNKYGNFADLSAEIEALGKFEDIKQSSARNLRTTQFRIIMGFILILLLTVVFAVLSFVMSFRTTEDIRHIYDGPLAVRYNALQLSINAHEAYLAMRNLALCHETDTDGINYYIDSTRKSISLMYVDFAVLKSLVAENEALAAKFDELNSLLEDWEEIREKNIQFAREGDMASCRTGVAQSGTLAVNKMNACISEIVLKSTDIAAIDYAGMLNRSRVFDINLIVLSAVIIITGAIVIAAITRHTANSIKLVDNAQLEQNKILDELMIMDETLRQNLATMERDAEITKKMKERYANSLEASNDSIWELDLANREFFASEKWTDVTGMPPMTIFDEESVLLFVHEDDRTKFKKAFTDKSGPFSVQVRAKTASSSADDSPRWLHIRGKWLNDHRLTGSVSDVTQKKQAEQYIEYIAYHDTITHLPNRAKFVETLEVAIKNAEVTGSNGCVLFIDLDNFKMINDGHGHDFGDKILAEVAERLKKSVQESSMIARFGGDEFLVLAENISGEEELHRYIKSVTDALSEPVSLDGGLFFITASIGVSRFPEDGGDVSQILKNSDAAMYASKFAGRNTFAFYDKLMSAKLARKAAIADILRNAVEKDAIYLVYQPQVRCSDGKAVSCEALMRLKDIGLGFISPAEFIPIAEETRLIVPLGYWAIRQAIETDIELRKRGITLDNISVNVSEIQLRKDDFAVQVKNIIDDYDYDASRLHLEITESLLLSNLEEQIAILNKVRDIGVRIELDDFGTGYSSLNYVRMIPLDVIKIDKCFIDEIGVDSEKEELIDLIVRLAKMNHAEVVAEGVETAQQAEFFKEKDGDILLQGYYYSKPLELNDLQVKFEELNSAAL